MTAVTLGLLGLGLGLGAGTGTGLVGRLDEGGFVVLGLAVGAVGRLVVGAEATMVAAVLDETVARSVTMDATSEALGPAVVVVAA